MPQIPSRLQNDEWQPRLEWPGDCLVQWGRKGIVFGGNGTYTTAFVEAFPNDGSAGFIRGEGKTLDEAEGQAHAEYTRNKACNETGGHRWTRTRRLSKTDPRKTTTYTNGGCFCLKCGAFSSNAMGKVVQTGAWKKPISSMELSYFMEGGLRPNERFEMSKPLEERLSSALFRKRIRLRLKMVGIDVPDHERPEYHENPDQPLFTEDAYTEACERAAAEFFARNADAITSETSGMAGLFDGLALRGLKRAAEEHGFLSPEPVAEESLSP